MNEEMRQERIETYLSGTMSEENRKKFEDELATDAGLQQAVAAHSNTDIAIRRLQSNALKSRLAAIDSEMDASDMTKNGTTAVVRQMYRKIAVAAVILLVVAGGATILMKGSQATMQELATEYYAEIQVDELRSGQKGRPVENDWRQRLIVADQDFREGKYEEAAAIFQDLEDENLIHQEKIQWNLLMSYLAMDGKEEKAKSLLKVILSNPDHGFYDQAVTIEKKIR